MGASASLQTNVTNITNSIKNQIDQRAAASASTKCTITIDSISFSKTNGCAIKLANNCFAEAEATVKIVSEVLAQFYNNLENNQKQEAATWFTATVGVATNVNNVVNDFSNYLTQHCNAVASTEESIKVKNVTINDCTAPSGQTLSMEFINTGKAKGVCAMEVFNNLVATASSDIANKQSQGLNWSTLIWPIAIIVCVIAIVYSIITIIVKKIPSNAERLEITKAEKENYSTRISDLLSFLKQN